MCPWGVLGTSLGVLVGSPELPGGSSGRPWGCLEILGDTLGGPGCSWGLLGRLRGGSWGSLGSPCRDLVPHMLRTPMFQRVQFFVALASLFRLFVALAKLKVTQRNSVNPAEARAHQTLCTAMF